mmetsp:Transcript_24186/g.61629  ORF Transcript_24186/g.61629 Transcript_24186/m.61629 type:complete len:290 (-) Transcript_24186:528-1397(-)
MRGATVSKSAAACAGDAGSCRWMASPPFRGCTLPPPSSRQPFRTIVVARHVGGPQSCRSKATAPVLESLNFSEANARHASSLSAPHARAASTGPRAPPTETLRAVWCVRKMSRISRSRRECAVTTSVSLEVAAAPFGSPPPKTSESTSLARSIKSRSAAASAASGSSRSGGPHAAGSWPHAPRAPCATRRRSSYRACGASVRCVSYVARRKALCVNAPGAGGGGAGPRPMRCASARNARQPSPCGGGTPGCSRPLSAARCSACASRRSTCPAASRSSAATASIAWAMDA